MPHVRLAIWRSQKKLNVTLATASLKETQSQKHVAKKWFRLIDKTSHLQMPISATIPSHNETPGEHGFESRWLSAGKMDTTYGAGRLGQEAIVALLVMEGRAILEWQCGIVKEVPSGAMAWLNFSAGPPICCRLEGASCRQQALVLTYPLDWVRRSLGRLRQELAADLQTLLLGPCPAAAMVLRALEADDRVWARALLASTLCAEARNLLEGSRMSEFFFRKVLLESRGEEHFCTRTRRLALERVARVREAFLQDLENPPNLEALARLCGCHPQYLSRTFSETAGMTISHCLRRLRIERAAELLASGQMNASEAALEVGYRSLSHFSQAFRAEKGTSPSGWMRHGARALAA